MWVAKRNHLKLLRYLVKKGVRFDIADSEGLSPLDQAIINANYDCAIYLKRQGLTPKSLDFYGLHTDRFLFEEVDFRYVLENLEKDVSAITDGYMKEKEDNEPKFKDPVIDPNQSWSDVFSNMREFKAPKMVKNQNFYFQIERDQVDATKLKKSNSFFQGAASMIYKIDLDRAKDPYKKTNNSHKNKKLELDPNAESIGINFQKRRTSNNGDRNLEEEEKHDIELGDVYIIGDDLDKIESELDERSGFEKKINLGEENKNLENDENQENENTKAIKVDNEDKV